jgi:predicted nucleotidyltransferase/HEPN domain-containing protein
MKTTTEHLPMWKRQELENIVSFICRAVRVEMIILFGSYARGDFVDYDFRFDHKEGHFTSYESDFDLMVIVHGEKKANDFHIWPRLENQLSRKVPTPVSLIVEDIEHVNEQLSLGRYLYADMKKEGILLYDSKRFQLVRAKKLSPEEKRRLAREDCNIWFPRAKDLYRVYEFCCSIKSWNLAAFNLHQVTESLFAGASLVLTSYKPRTHDLEKLTKRMEKFDPDFCETFPRKEGEEKRLFELLQKAYTEARYSKHYKISKRELEYLAERVKKLRRLAMRKSREKIKQF